MEAKWEQKINSLIRKFDSSVDPGSFRNQYRDAVALGADRLTDEARELLWQLLDALEQWTSPQPPEPTTAFTQWSQLSEAADQKLPRSILYSVLKKFPKAGLVDFSSVVFTCRDVRVIELLLARSVIRAQDLNRLAKQNPSEFYVSAGLDALLARRALKAQAAMWEQCNAGTSRPTELLPTQAVAVRLYAANPKPASNELMLDFLRGNPAEHEATLELLLEHRPSALRLCRYVLEVAFRKKLTPERLVDLTALMSSSVASCEKQIARGRNAITASLIVAMIRLDEVAAEADRASPARGVWAAAAQSTERQFLQMMRDEQRDSTRLNPAFVVNGAEVQQAFAKYLRALPQVTSHDAPTDLSAQHQRHLGSKVIAEEILRALDEVSDAGPLRDAIEVALFNSGVQPLGEVGKTISFDPKLHQPQTPGIITGDQVVVSFVGRVFGTDSNRVILRKARVRAVNA